MKWKWAWKIFEIGKDSPKTLFHGVRGSRVLPIGEWIEAEEKEGTNGSRVANYLTGFHAYPNMDSIEKWLRGAHRLEGRVLCRVQIAECRAKPRACRPTILAKYLRIPKQSWAKRILAEKVKNGQVSI